jgi:trimeric autotransporter adhesin
MRLKPLVMLGLVLAAVFAAGAFSRTQHNRISVSKNGSGSGTVTSDAPGPNASPINCGSSCTGYFKEGFTVTLSASPDSGSTFSGWGGACGGTGSCSVTIPLPADVLTINVSATFTAPPKYLLTVANAGAGKGTVQSTPTGINCPGACANGFVAGTSVVLTATPDAISVFASWAGACSGTQPTCTVTVDQAKSVTATFDQKPFTVSVSRTGTGAGTVTSSPAGIACGTTCSADLAGNVQLTATPTAGSAFTGWGGACSGTGACALTMDAAKEVEARFADTAAPLVKARPGAGKRGKTVRLRYSVTDASGRVTVRVKVLRGKKQLAAIAHPAAAIRAGDSVAWRVPASLKPGALRFCVVATDPAGNTSASSCAALRIT